MKRKIAKVALSVLLCGSLLISLWSGWGIVTGWPGAALVERGRDEIIVSMDRALARHATEAEIISRLTTLLEAEPRNWMSIEAIEEVADSRAIDLSPELLARRTELYSQDRGIQATSVRCVACAWDPRSCDFSAILFCRVPIDLTPLGDLASVLREGHNFARGQEVDIIDLGLSAVGLAAVALTPATGGSSMAVKAGAGMGKIAWRMRRLSEGVSSTLRRALTEGFNWANITSTRSISDIAGLARPVALRPALSIVSDIGRMRAAVGSRRALYLLPYADTPTEARRLSNAAEAMGPRSIGALELLGKSRFLRATLRWSDEVWWVISGILGLVVALTGLFWSLLSSRGLHLLRRMAR